MYINDYTNVIHFLHSHVYIIYNLSINNAIFPCSSSMHMHALNALKMTNVQPRDRRTRQTSGPDRAVSICSGIQKQQPDIPFKANKRHYQLLSASTHPT